MCLVGTAAARRHGGTAVSWWRTMWHLGTMVSRWRTRWHGGTVVSRWRIRWHGGTVVSHWRTKSHGGTVAHQVSRRHGCGMSVAGGTVWQVAR